MTHFVPYDAPAIGRHARAFCGELVDPKRQHSAAPECRDCARASTAPPLFSMAEDNPADVDLFDVEFDDLELEPAADMPALEAPAAATVLAFPAPALTPSPVIDDIAMMQTSLQRTATTLTLADQGLSLAAQATALQVIDAATCEQGEVLYRQLCDVEKGIHEHYDPHCDRAHKVWKGLTDERGVQLRPVEAAKKVIGPRVAEWKADIERRENDAQRAREAAARKEQQENAQRAARQAIREGDVVTAAAIVEEAKHLPAPILPRAASAAPSTGLTTTRKPWKTQIDNFDALITAIAGQRDAMGLRNLTEFDEAIIAAIMPILNRQATTLKSELGKRYPGTTGTQKPTLAGR